MTLHIGSNLCAPGLWCNTFCCCCRFHIRSKWLRFLSGFILALTAARCACSLEPGFCCAPTAGLPAPSSAPPLLLQALAAKVSQARPPGSAPKPCTLLPKPACTRGPAFTLRTGGLAHAGRAGRNTQPRSPPAGRRAGLPWRPPPAPPARPPPAAGGAPSAPWRAKLCINKIKQVYIQTSLHLSSQVLRGPCPLLTGRCHLHTHTHAATRTSPPPPAQGRGGLLLPCSAVHR